MKLDAPLKHKKTKQKIFLLLIPTTCLNIYGGRELVTSQTTQTSCKGEGIKQAMLNAHVLNLSYIALHWRIVVFRQEGGFNFFRDVLTVKVVGSNIEYSYVEILR